MHGTNRDPWLGLRGNLLLQSLAAHEALALAPHLHRVHLSPGERLTLDRSDAALIYFPETAIACLGMCGTFEIGMVGHEGVIGWDALLGCGIGQHDGMIQLGGGSALAMSAIAMRKLCAGHPMLAERLARFGLIFAVQMATTLVSNLHDGHDRRLSRWLLMFHDRVAGDDLAITHNALAALMHVRRATITDALHVLEGDHVVRCTRGRIAIRDRVALEARAAHAYGMAEHSYRSAIGAFGKSR